MLEDSSAKATSSSASSNVDVNGFSQTTCLPASSAALARVKCDSGGVVIITNSTSVAHNSSGVLTICNLGCFSNASRDDRWRICVNSNSCVNAVTNGMWKTFADNPYPMIPTLLQTSLISHQKDKNIGFCAAIPQLFLRRVCVRITRSVDSGVQPAKALLRCFVS